MARPTSVGHNVRRATMPTTAVLCASSAMRTPTSRVRCVHSAGKQYESEQRTNRGGERDGGFSPKARVNAYALAS
jgi:hypothetical protein